MKKKTTKKKNFKRLLHFEKVVLKGDHISGGGKNHFKIVLHQENVVLTWILQGDVILNKSIVSKSTFRLASTL